MTDKLPPNLLALFAPRPPLRWVPPCDHPSEERRTAAVGGVAEFLPHLAAYKDADNYVPTESWLQKRDRKKLEQKAAAEQLLQEVPKSFKPQEDPNIRGDAFKTLMVSRLSYDATEEDLEREFGRVGAIERIRIVRDTHAEEKGNKKIKPHRGYAFIVFEREKDMRAPPETMALKLACLVPPPPSSQTSQRDYGSSGGGGGGGGGGAYGRRDDDKFGGGGGYRGADRGASGSNAEPIGARHSGPGSSSGGGYRDRDYGRDDSRKRPYEGGSGYEGERKLRRY
ncbi:hypothetical protein SLS53_006424 [Cytospora paraplurivora]|uniref:RRM domain-containing protein n=1 Tax=Cytospora paraplurivora TaxID=2898453 RepID=A0AAN9UBD1_9PEZI